MQEGHFYYLSDNYFIDFPDEFLMKNKEMIDGKPHNRPCFYAFKDINTGLYWMIPFSSQVDKFRKIYNKKVKKYKHCNTIRFGHVLGKEKAFLIQNMCPVIDKYILNQYMNGDSQIPVQIDNVFAKRLVSDAKQVLLLQRKGMKLIFPDVLKIEATLLSYTDLLQDINKLNEITHDHSIVAIQDTFNEYPNRFLVYDDPQWKCKLFINYKDNMNNENFIKDHLSRELKVDISSITVRYISQIISEKISGRDNIEKVYCHKLFLVKIEDIPEHMKNDTFECDGRTYHWENIVDLENDDEAMKKNSDIIRFVKENI